MSDCRSDLNPLITRQAVRLCALERRLRRGMWTATSVLLEDLKVSLPTLKRDIKMLREEFGAPIQADIAGQGYRCVGAWKGLCDHLVATLKAL